MLYQAVLGVVGLILTLTGYVALLGKAAGSPWTLLGFSMLCAGYICVLVADGKEAVEAYRHEEKKEKVNHAWADPKRIGFLVLFLFFFGVHIFPALTFTVRMYDWLAAIGYGLAFTSTWFASAGWFIAACIFLTLYYMRGSVFKINEPGWISQLQMVSRAMMALFYGSAIFLGA